MYVICKEAMSEDEILDELISHWQLDSGWSDLAHVNTDLNMCERVLNSPNYKDSIQGLVKPSYKESGYVIRKVKLEIIK